jgi:hypothetical protein
MIRLLYIFQLPIFCEARNPAKFSNSSEVGSVTTALAGVKKRTLHVDFSSFQSTGEVVP